MKSSLILVVVLALVPLSRADEMPGTEVVDEEDIVAASIPMGSDLVRTASPQEKSMEAAYVWAAGLTVVPSVFGLGILLIGGDAQEIVTGFTSLAGGLVVGPSAGELYAGAIGYALFGSTLRAAACVVGLYYTDMGLFLKLWGAGAAFSLVETYFAVNRANERARKAAVKTSLAPVLFPLAEGRFAPGLAFNASF